MRVFIALEVGPAATPSDPGAPRAAAEHLTLRFLGEVPSEQVPGIATALERVAHASAPFDMVVEGLGAFPSRANPRVVWVGVTHGRHEVTRLANRIDAELSEREKVPAPREKFVPHLTLFRVRSPQLRRRAVDLLDGVEPPPAPRTIPVRDVFLKESTLTSRGAQHRTLGRWPLTGPPEPSA